MSELKEGWRECGFMDVFDIKGGTQPPKKEFLFAPQDGYIRLLQIRDFGDKPFPVYVPLTKKMKLCNVDDVLLARYGGQGKILTGMEGAYNVAIAKVIIPDYILSKFAYYLLKSHIFFDFVTKIERSAIDGYNKDDLAKLIIPVPPINEQKAIVQKLEQLLSKLNGVNERLDKIPTILKRFRQSVLSAACGGKLTADWRVGKELGEWVEMKLKDVVIDKAGIFDGPFGSNLKTSDYVNIGVRVIRLENVGALNFIGTKYTYISEEKYQTLKKHTVQSGDIIFSSFIADSVRVCQLPKIDTIAIAKADCFCIRPKPALLHRKYLCYALSNPDKYNDFLQLLHGATRPRINTTQLKSMTIPLPKLFEQEEIVRRVDALFVLADKIEAHYRIAKQSLVRAEKAVYARAFKGEL
jgi:type I restriction enzyme, S subunit